VVTLFASLFVLMVSANVATWRSAVWAQTPGLQLPDLLLAVLPRWSDGEFLANLLLIASGGVLAVMFLLTGRHPIMFVDAVWLEIVCVLVKAVAQAVTTLPDVNLQRSVCHDPALATPGWWMASRVTATFCGDMLWSGHTSHMILVHIFLLRLLDLALFARPRQLIGQSPASPHSLPAEVGMATVEATHEHKVLFSMVSGIDMPPPPPVAPKILPQQRRRRSPVWVFRLLWGLSFLLCFTVCVSLLLARIHYTVDVLLAVGGTLLLASHKGSVTCGRKWLLSGSSHADPL
jgi:hypothetical protein